MEQFQLARNLAKDLKPQMGSSGNAAEDLKRGSEHLVRILEKMERSARGTGPQPSSLIPKAFSFVEGVGKQHQMTTTAALMKSWNDARGMGLFDEAGKFGRRITRGRDVGQNMVFEHLVTIEQSKTFGRHYGNVRLTIPSRVRVEGAKLSARDGAAVAQWANVLREIESRKNSMISAPSTEKLERERHNKLWEAQMTQVDQESRDQISGVKVLTRMTGGGTHRDRGRRRFQVALMNQSPIPTEVEVTFWAVGEGEAKNPKERLHYLMTKQVKKVRLLANEQISFELFGPGERSLNGHVTDVHHAKGRAGYYASSSRLEAHLMGGHGGLGAFQPWPKGR